MGLFSSLLGIFRRKQPEQEMPLEAVPEEISLSTIEIPKQTPEMDNIKAKMDLVSTRFDTLNTQYQILNEKVSVMEKMTREIYEAFRRRGYLL